jgi:uncharacterized repeat protein (TIGR01451 family)
MQNFPGGLIAAAFLSLSSGLIYAQGPYLVATYAGGIASATAAPAVNFSFENTTGVATDSFGNTYISSTYNCVFRLDPSGNLSRVAGTCQAGFSGDGGNAINAQLNGPQGIALDAGGNLYIADQVNNRIRRVTPTGIISTVAGTGVAGYSGDNVQATATELNAPQGVAVDAAGDLYIAEAANYRVRKVAPNGTITTVAGTGTSSHTGDGGAATAATLSQPTSLAIDAAGNLYIADSGANEVRMVNSSGSIVRIAGTGNPGYNGEGHAAVATNLSYPEGLAFDSHGNLYIADRGDYRVWVMNIAGIMNTYAGGRGFGSGGDGGQAASAQLTGPIGVATDYSGDLFIGDFGGVVREVNSSGIINTVAGNSVSLLPSGSDGQPAALTPLGTPWGLARDSSGDLYIADWQNERVRKVDAAGVISTVAGNGGLPDSGDGQPATAASVVPFGVAVDAAGNLYLADASIIRKIDTAGIISTIAGTSLSGYNGDDIPANTALVGSYMPGIAVDTQAQPNIYISDWINQRVRKISTATGLITTVAGTGTGGYSGDGNAATAALVKDPAGLAFDSTGNLYIADFGNCRVRRVSIAGIITTVAGNGTCASTGDSGPATAAGITNPWGVAVDALGNLYISTSGNTIRKVSGGNISTIAGTGVAGFSGDGGPAALAQFNNPTGIAVDGAGNVYVSDFGNGAVRILQPLTEPLLTVSSTHAGIFPAGQTGTFSIAASNAPQAATSNGIVTVTAMLPAGMTPVSMSGSGWSCSYSTPPFYCQNSGPLAGGSSLTPITLTVPVPPNAPTQLANQVSVSGGGAFVTGSEDLALVGAANPSLSIAVTHSGNFFAGGSGTFDIVVGNQTYASATSGTVTVSDSLPPSLTLGSLQGTGWNCTGATCTTSAPLPGGAMYEPIMGTVTVASNGPSSVTNSATVSGGGAAGASGSDTIAVVTLTPCNIEQMQNITVTDIQAVINQALGSAAVANDLNQDGVVNVEDIQIVVNAALALGCTI